MAGQESVLPSNMGFRYVYDTDQNECLNLLNYILASKINFLLINTEVHIAIFAVQMSMIYRSL
jgi:hypothetical protein